MAYDDPLTFEDNLFGDITFENFHGINITKIGSNVFNKTGNKIKSFNYYYCDLENQLPKYSIKLIYNQITQLTHLKIGLNVNKIPTDAFGIAYNLKIIIINMKSKEFTIKSGAFK